MGDITFNRTRWTQNCSTDQDETGSNFSPAEHISTDKRGLKATQCCND